MIVTSVPAWPSAWPRRPGVRIYWFVTAWVLISIALVLGLVPIVTRMQSAAAAAVLLWGGSHLGGTAMFMRFLLFPYFRRRSMVGVVGPALAIRYRSARLTVAAFGIPYITAGGLMLIGVGLRLGDMVTVVYGVLLTAVGAVLAVLALQVGRGRYGLHLTPDEVQWRSVRRTASVSWEAVYGVDAEHVLELTGPVASPDQGLNIRVRLAAYRIAGLGKPPEDDILIPAGQLAAAPALAFWVVDHYFRHPEHRHELGTEAALERIRRGPE